MCTYICHMLYGSDALHIHMLQGLKTARVWLRRVVYLWICRPSREHVGGLGVLGRKSTTLTLWWPVWEVCMLAMMGTADGMWSATRASIIMYRNVAMPVQFWCGKLHKWNTDSLAEFFLKEWMVLCELLLAALFMPFVQSSITDRFNHVLNIQPTM